MRNFFLLIRRFWNYILFLILEIASFAMIAKNRSIQGNDLVNSSNAMAGFVLKKQNDVAYYFNLKRMNDSLLQENTRLHNQIAQNSNVDTFRNVQVSIPATVPDTTTKAVKDSTGKTKMVSVGGVKVVRYAHYNYIPARVINNSISNERVNYITLNRGSADGIKTGMAVVTSSGIVGRVANVSLHYATVASVLSDRPVSSKLAEGTKDLVTVWNPGSPDFVVTEKVPLYIKVKKGDTVLTSGYSYFPENILIGTVVKVDTAKATNTKNLKVRLSTNFRKLQYVYVVENTLAAERDSLEAATIEAQQANTNNNP
ncbi:MAG: rod shape-determining protein MreC [Edaphocola sp.]